MTTVDTLDTPQSRDQLPEGWRTVRFDQMADSITERVDNPAEAGVTYYVGLEHLDPESLHIRRWGAPTDVEATKLRFQLGDIIFGRRRAYQRKVAVAEFEGICSAHALVLRAKEETVVKEFLPFFMQSDTFFERAMSISVGSLSPTINWKTLAQQEFAIPPKDEQRRIAEILWAADEALQKMQIVFNEIRSIKKHIIQELVTHGIGHSEFKDSEIGRIPSSWEVKPVSQVCLAVIDCKNRTPPYVASGFPVARTVNIRDGRFIIDPLSFTDEESYMEWTKRGKPQPGDVLITREAPLGEVCLIPEGMELCLGQRVMLYRPNPKHLLNTFLLAALLCDNTQRRLHRVAGGSTVGHVKVGDIRDLFIPVPPLEEQQQIANIFLALNASEDDVASNVTSLEKQRKSLITNLLSGTACTL